MSQTPAVVVPQITFVPSEKTHPQIAGSIYPGSAVRIMLRSPRHVVYNSLGCNIWNRDKGGGWHNIKKLFDGRPTIAEFEKVRGRFDDLLGPGVGEALLHAWRKNLTVLLDGGGEPMPPTRMKQRAMQEEAYAKVTVNWTADLTGEVKTCRQCGKALQIDTDHHRLGFEIKPDHPRSLEDCQRLTNRRVVAIHDYGHVDRSRIGFVKWFETWDGESYHYLDFCSDKCAATYGRRAARELPPLEVGGEAIKRPHRIRNDVELNPKPERRFKLADGTTIEY